MIDQFLVFDSSGTVNFNYQPGKNYARVANAFINDVLINERKMRYVEGSEMIGNKNTQGEENAAEAAEAEANAALYEIEEDEEAGDYDGKDSDDNDDNNNRSAKPKIKNAGMTEYSEEMNKYVDADINLGSYIHDGFNLKYLVWTNEKTKKKLYFVMIYASLITIMNPFEFLKNVKILYENCSTDTLKFEKFFHLKLTEITEVKQEPTKTHTELVNENKKGKPETVKRSKKSRKWNADGTFYEDDGKDESELDFSTGDIKPENYSSSNIQQLVGDRKHFGTKTSEGFLVSDLSDEMNKIIISSKKKIVEKEKKSNSAASNAFGFLKKYIGGKKITKEDVSQIKTAMTQHLIKKNVSPNVANSLMAEVEKDLVGQTTESFTSVEDTAKTSLAKQLRMLLTPNSSIDLLHEIQSKKERGLGPYSISVVGVNGVGKSTNLSKLAFWLLQNDYRVLVAACDTFRSGAVEQLRTHVNNLVQLSPNKKQIELFESGYGGADLVAKIATGAIKYAKEHNFDIVLMDTAGRRHNDSHLMAPLASFAKAANPDKIIMVGEALVGTDSVLQAQNFNKAFGANRHLDFFIISKCDTVGDLIGSMVNMVFATGIPILFVGTGQTYTDLRTLSVNWAVEMLMS